MVLLSVVLHDRGEEFSWKTRVCTSQPKHVFIIQYNTNTNFIIVALPRRVLRPQKSSV